MFTSGQAKESLQNIVWEEGKIVPIAEGPYRYRIIALCSMLGRQKAMFTNGEYPYFCYVEHLDGKGQWIQKGAGTVPVLPDGRLIMIVEQRPAQDRYSDRPMVAEIGGKKIDLHCFGAFSSLEFPGGAIEPGEGFRAGFLRELQEETGVGGQDALCYTCLRPIYGFGSDIACQQFLGVAFLSGFSFANRVENDGGLTVIALTRTEVEENILRGVIHSGQAAMLEWHFYEQVEKCRQDPDFERKLVATGYLSIQQVQVVKQ